MRQFWLVLLFLVCTLGTLYGRDIRVHIFDGDLDLPLEGATLQTADGTILKANADGIILVQAPDGQAITVRVSYPGYQSLKLAIPAAATGVEAKMALQGAMGSTDLVVEARKPGKGDEKSGVSTNVSRAELRNTANLGVIEDVMTTIKALPGVGYAGGFNALPSIRGGEPLELTATLDGFIIENPFHWGGIYSIFDPNMVENAKLSNGVFSAVYGYATSGLLEVTSREPSATSLRGELGITTSSANLLVSIPSNGTGGLMIGAKSTYWDPEVALIGLFAPSVTKILRQAPYIRDVYLKGSWHLDPRLIYYINGFFGCDGIGLKVDNSNTGSGLSYATDFTWANYISFISMGLKWQPSDQSLVHFMVGGGWASSVNDFKSVVSGTLNYSPEFTAWYNANYNPDLATTNFSLNQDSQGNGTNNSYNVQARLDYELQAASWLNWKIGATEFIQFWQRQTSGHIYADDGSGTLVPTTYSIKNDGNRALNSAAYTTATFATPDKDLTLELGLRLDHIFIAGKDGYSLQTYPVLNPRANLEWIPIKNKDQVESLTFSIGTGLFSRPPAEMALFDTSYNLSDFQVKPNQVWTSVLGTELRVADGWKIQIEGYYKEVFNRFYFNETLQGATLNVKPHFDGEARIWGIDLMVQKYESRYFDGWLTASYNWARYRNPTLDLGSVDPQTFGPSTATTDWFWPGFHRFFNANLILNFKPVTGFTITARLAFATGKPMTTAGTPVPVYLTQGSTVIEQWRRAETYSDTERTEFSIPLDLRVSWNWYEPRSKVYSEFYIAAENVLTNLYSPKSRPMIDPYTGKEMTGSGQADFNLGFPMISIGFKWSY